MDLIGGYRIPFDPFPILAQLEKNRVEALNILWENLHHQGDVDTAAYASVPALVEAGEIELVSVIEVCRHYVSNPEVPETLLNSYNQAIVKAVQKPPTDKSVLQSYYSLHASFYGNRDLALALHLMIVEDILNH